MSLCEVSETKKKEFLSRCIHFKLLGKLLFLCIANGFSKKGLENTRNSIDLAVYEKIKKKSKKALRKYVYNDQLEQKDSDYIWMFWAQGEKNMPSLVKKCVESVRKNNTNKKIVVIDFSNMDSYIKIPDYIMEKVKNKKMTLTHFSDILRIYLLAEYGGVWIDATVYFSKAIPSFVDESELFMFQLLKPGLDGHPIRISSWFIKSYSNNEIVALTKYLLDEYWKKANRLCDYFLLHNFVEIAIEKYPEVWEKVLPISPDMPHLLLLNFDRKYDLKTYNYYISSCFLQKLSYKNVSEETDTMFDYFIKN